jgi:hypothetical protein
MYRRDHWQAQPVHVEVWCEKDALTSILSPVCRKYGVTFATIRGFDSESLAYESANDLHATGKPSHIITSAITILRAGGLSATSNSASVISVPKSL